MNGPFSLDSQIVEDGDIGFTGFASRPDPMTLPVNLAQMARNKRFVRGRAETRKGLKRMASDINIPSVPLTLPFTLAAPVAVASLTRTGSTATLTATDPHGLVTNAVVHVTGATQPEYNGDHVITTTGFPATFTFPISGTPATPATGTILWAASPVVRSSYDGGLFGACVFRSPDYSAGEELMALAGGDALWLWKSGAAAVQVPYASGEAVTTTDRVQMFQAFDTLYILRDAGMDGEYARQGVTSLTRSSTTATLTTATAHGLTTGMRIRIEGADQAGWNHEFDVTVTGPSEMTWTVAHDPATPATATTGAITWRRVRGNLYWKVGMGTVQRTVAGSHPAGATFRRMPSAGMGAYFNNMVVVAPTPARDEIWLSDILDGNTYDELLKSFRANAGSSDYLVALHPYGEGQLLLFMRNSIYRARILLDETGTGLAPESFIELLTNEVGCAARDSVVTAGQYVYFLSDAGVYRLESNFTDLKLRGMTMPLSDTIADQMERVNAEAMGTASGVWFDNRYWLSVPTGDATFPNEVWIYNALNEAWESVDVYPAAINALVVGTHERRRRLFGVTRAGAVFLMNENPAGDEAQDATITDLSAINGVLVTRRYVFGNSLPKRFLRNIVSVILEAGSSVETLCRISDPDRELVLGSTANPGSEAEDYVQKLSVRSRGSAAEVEVRDTGGRSTVRTVLLQAVVDNPRMSTRTEN